MEKARRRLRHARTDRQGRRDDMPLRRLPRRLRRLAHADGARRATGTSASLFSMYARGRHLLLRRLMRLSSALPVDVAKHRLEGTRQEAFSVGADFSPARRLIAARTHAAGQGRQHAQVSTVAKLIRDD